MEAIENTSDEDFSGFVSHIYSLKLDKLVKLREELLEKLEYGSPITKMRLSMVETQMVRLNELPYRKTLKEEMLKYYCLCNKHEFSSKDCAFEQMYKKYPFLIESYLLSDLSQEIMWEHMNSNLEKRKELCQSYVTSDNLTKEQAIIEYKYIKCNNCGTLNEYPSYVCSKCRFQFF